MTKLSLLAIILLLSHAGWALALDIETYLALPETAQQSYVLGFTDGLVQGLFSDPDHKFTKRLTTSVPEQQRCVTTARTLHSTTQDLLQSAKFDATQRKRVQVQQVVWLALDRLCTK